MSDVEAIPLPSSIQRAGVDVNAMFDVIRAGTYCPRRLAGTIASSIGDGLAS